MKRNTLIKIGITILVALVAVSAIFALRPSGGDERGTFTLKIYDENNQLVLENSYYFDEEQTLFDFLDANFTITFTDYGEMGKFVNTITLDGITLPGGREGAYLSLEEEIDGVVLESMVGYSSYYLEDGDIVIIRDFVYEG